LDARTSPSKKGYCKKLKRLGRMNLLKRKNIPVIVYDQNKEAFIEKVNSYRDKLPHSLDENNFDKCIEIAKELLKIAIQLKNLNLFTLTLEVIGDFYISNNDFNNAIYFYNQLRIIGDFTDNIRLKIKSLIELAQTCKTLHFFNYSKLFLKKALQYAWLNQYDEVEVQLYDKMGLLYYL
jgi:hypothetical protein